MNRTDLIEIRRLKLHEKLMESSPDSSCIKMTLRDDTDFLSDFWADQPVISSEAADYLDNALKALNKKDLENLSIEISSAPLDGFEKKIFSDAIHNYYSNRLHENHNDLHRNQRNSLILFLIGAFVLALMVALEHFGMRPYFSEIFDIIGWVFIWEATDEFCLERYDLVAKERSWKALSQAKVSFSELDELDCRLLRYQDRK